MELKDFIKESITQIATAVNESRDALKNSTVGYSGHMQSIEFDVSVEVNETNTKNNKVSGSVDVGGSIIAIKAKGKTEGEHTSVKENANKNSNRIKFSVPIDFCGDS